MVTTGVDAIFIDTNILVYAQQSYSPFHQKATATLQQHAAAGAPLCLSRQILREYLAAMTRPAIVAGATSVPSLIADIVSFEAQFIIAEDSTHVNQTIIAVTQQGALWGKASS